MLKYVSLLLLSLNIFAYDYNCLGKINQGDRVRTEVYLGHTVNGYCQPDNNLLILSLLEIEGVYSYNREGAFYNNIQWLVADDFSEFQELASYAEFEWKLEYEQKLSGANCVYIHMVNELGSGCCKAGVNFHIEESKPNPLVADSSYLNNC